MYVVGVFCLAFIKDAGETKEPPVSEGDIIELGSYKQSKNLKGNWDVSAIDWIVLDITEDKVLLLSKNGLTYRAYSENSNSSWDNSSLRGWLNQEFVQNTFRVLMNESVSRLLMQCLFVKAILYLLEGKDLCHHTTVTIGG